MAWRLDSAYPLWQGNYCPFSAQLALDLLPSFGQPTFKNAKLGYIYRLQNYNETELCISGRRTGKWGRCTPWRTGLTCTTCTAHRSLLWPSMCCSESWAGRPLHTASPGHRHLWLALGLTNGKYQRKNGRQKREVEIFITLPPLTLSFFCQRLHLSMTIILVGWPLFLSPRSHLGSTNTVPYPCLHRCNWTSRRE